MTEGLLYEPRSLWSIGNIQAGATAAAFPRVQLNRNHFKNGTRWPMTFDRVALSGVNYIFNTLPSGVPDNAYHQVASILNSVKLSISSPMRFHFSPKRYGTVGALSPRATQNPGSTAVYGSSLQGQSMLQLPQPLRIPKDGAIQWDLSAMSPWVIAGESDISQSTTPLDAWMVYQEVGGLFTGSARSFNAQLPPMIPGAYPAADQELEERWPYPPDFFGATTYAAGTSNFWDPRAAFTPRNFKQQNPTRAGSTEITDLRVMIDQRQYDLDLNSALDDGGFGPAKPVQIATRVGTRIQTTNCGSETWWWRPGAPLALVFDTITPALVYNLQEPITLGPGDTLEVQMEVPGLGPASQQPFYHVGISFNGYSPIEG